MRDSPIKATVDFDRDGVQHGFLKLPYSRDDSAWGSLMIPITVIRRGSGPSVLLTGGNHGDEYEGPVALTKLASALQAEAVSGCVIIIPFLNYPAFRAGRRTSPIDGGNMNRSFPGRPDGTLTEKIADYVQRELLPRVDAVLDLHAGGKTLNFIPFAAIHVLDDKQQQARCQAAMEAFAAPYALKLVELDSVGLLDTAAEQAGKVFVSTELGGGGSTTAASVAIAEGGVRRFLAHAGVLRTAPEPSRASALLDMPADGSYVQSEDDGLLEMCKDLGEPVRSGDILARIYDPARTGRAPACYRARCDGILAGRHFPGLIQCGDTLAMIAQVMPAAT